jgi:polyhydroxybutyrate depolymerase
METAAILILSTAGLCGAVYLYRRYSTAPRVPKLSGAIQRSTICVGDRERSYLAYVPTNLPPQSALIIVLHGAGMNGKRIRECTGYEFDRLADRRGFTVLYPDGYRHAWNDCRKKAPFPAKRENIDDVSFIRALIDHFKVEKAIDDKRVYAFGYSNGGYMALRLAMQAPDEIAAVAAVAACLPAPDSLSCPQQGRTSRVMLMNGTADRVTPYQGGIMRLRSTILSSEASAWSLAERNGITVAPVIARLPNMRADDPTSVEILIWSADGKPVCCLYTVHGGGHVIPQPRFRFPRQLGKMSSALNAPSAAVSFFEPELPLEPV